MTGDADGAIFLSGGDCCEGGEPMVSSVASRRGYGGSQRRLCPERVMRETRRARCGGRRGGYGEQEEDPTLLETRNGRLGAD